MTAPPRMASSVMAATMPKAAICLAALRLFVFGFSCARAKDPASISVILCSPDQGVSQTLEIKPPAREQNNWTKVSPSLPVTYAERSFHRLIDFQCWLHLEK